MNKTELVNNMAVKSGLSKVDSEKALKAFMESVSEALISGDKVGLAGFGTFDVKEIKGRERTHTFGDKKGQTYMTEDKKSPKFKASKNIIDAMNGKTE